MDILQFRVHLRQQLIGFLNDWYGMSNHNDCFPRPIRISHLRSDRERKENRERLFYYGETGQENSRRTGHQHTSGE